MDIFKLANPAQQEVAGILASEDLDRDGEKFDYDASKVYFQKWAQDLYDATKKTALPGEESYGNVRLMHGKTTVGKLIKIVFDDVKKTIWGIAKVTDPKVWDDIQHGVYSAFSIAGKLVKAVMRNGKNWITVQPVEVSIVDYPSNPSTTFDWARGACFAKFASATPADGINTTDPAYAPDAVPDQKDPSPGPVVNSDPTAIKRGNDLPAARIGEPDTQGDSKKPESQDKKAEMISKNQFKNLIAAIEKQIAAGKTFGTISLSDVSKSIDDDTDTADARSSEHDVKQPDMDTQGEDTDGNENGIDDDGDDDNTVGDNEKSKLSKPNSGAKKMAKNEVEKAKMLSMHDHLNKLKAAVTKHAADVHDMCDKCMKLAGPTFDADTERDGGNTASGDSNAATDTMVKTMSAEIEKLVATVTALSAKLEAKDTAKAADTKKDEKVVGDPKDAVKTGEEIVAKAAADKIKKDAELDLAKAAFGLAKDGKRQQADPDAMNKLYDAVTTRFNSTKA